MGLSRKRMVANWPPERRRAFIESLPLEIVDEILREEWWWTSRPEQVPTPGEWMIYLILSGRGFGKTRSGSEWIVERTKNHPTDASGAPTERLVVAETIADARNVLLGGPSGILRVLDRRGIPYRYTKSPKPMIRFLESGSIIHAVGAENEDVGRGLNLADVWLDEVAKWPKPRESWFEGIMPALRTSLVGDHPRAFVTTTPKPISLLREWVSRDDGTVVVVRGSTFDNSDNLSPLVLEALEREYAGTSIGQQELYGVLLDDVVGKLFSQSHINLARIKDTDLPNLVDVVVGVDPGLTGEGDETGVVVVGVDRDGDWYVLADRSIMGVGLNAAIHCWKTVVEFGASMMVVETNLGRKWMTESFVDAYKQVAEQIGDNTILDGRLASPPIFSIDAKTGKELRARPVGMRCEQHRLHFVGRHKTLEDQCVEYDPMTSRDSPDRLDALVHACRYFMGMERRIVTISSPVGAVQREAERMQPEGAKDIFGQLVVVRAG